MGGWRRQLPTRTRRPLDNLTSGIPQTPFLAARNTANSRTGSKEVGAVAARSSGLLGVDGSLEMVTSPPRRNRRTRRTALTAKHRRFSSAAAVSGAVSSSNSPG